MISEQADEDAIIIWGAALDEEMDDTISVIVIATGFPTTDHYTLIDQKKGNNANTQFKYGNTAQKPEPQRMGGVMNRQQEARQRMPQPQVQPQYNPYAQQPAQPQYQQPEQQQFQQPVYPNANTMPPQRTQRPAQQNTQRNNDPDDSYMDIMSIFKNN